MGLGMGGMRGPRAPGFPDGIYSSRPFPRKAKVTGNTFPFFSALVCPFLTSQPNMAASRMEVCGQQAGREAGQCWWEIEG